MEAYSKEIWERVDMALKHQGKTLLDFSKSTGVPYGTVKGSRTKCILPKLPVVIALSEYLCVSIDWLVKGNTNQEILTQEQIAVRDDSDIRYMVKVMMNDKTTLSLVAALLQKTELMNARIS